MEEKKKKENACPSWGTCGWAVVPPSGQGPSLAGRSAGTERELSGLTEGPSNSSVADRTEWDLPQMLHAMALSTSTWEKCLPVHMRAGLWNVGFQEKTQWGDLCCLQECRSKEFLNRSAHGGSPDSTTERKHCYWVIGKGQDNHLSLSPHSLAPAFKGTREGSCYSQLVNSCHCLSPTPGPIQRGWHAYPIHQMMHSPTWMALLHWLLLEGLTHFNHYASILFPGGLLAPFADSVCFWLTVSCAPANTGANSRYTQRWGRSHSWASEALWLRKKCWNLPYSETWCYTSNENFLHSVSAKQLKGWQVFL